MKMSRVVWSEQLKWMLIGGTVLSATMIGVCSVPALYAQSSLERWLKVERFSGSVMTHVDDSHKTIEGDLLSEVGHGITTGQRSSAILVLDDGIGNIAVAQNTQVTVQELSILPDGSRVTVLNVPRGQARLQVRRFTHPQSSLEMHTPSGVAAVRGTIFGISVDEEGSTSVGTLEGRVEVSAEAVTVPVDAGMVSILHPGEEPSPARVMDRELDIQWDAHEWQTDNLYVAGYIDAANTLLVMGEEIPTDRSGYFEKNIPLRRRSTRVVITVQNPVGESRKYRFFPWLSPD